MASILYDLCEAKASLSELVERAAAGEENILTESGKPRARLVAVTRPRASKPRRPGGWEGRVWISPDFHGPLPDFSEEP